MFERIPQALNDELVQGQPVLRSQRLQHLHHLLGQPERTAHACRSLLNFPHEHTPLDRLVSRHETFARSYPSARPLPKRELEASFPVFNDLYFTMSRKAKTSI